MTEDYKYFVKTKGLVSIFILIGLFIGITVQNLNQAAYINRLEKELNDTREQLYISNDTLRQIEMFNEREYYMQQLEEDANE